MFSSHNKKSYQKIDDDYNDEILRDSTCTSRLFEGVSSTRSILFGGEGNDNETDSLMVGTSHSYHDAPVQSQPEVTYDQFTLQGPPTMASSAQIGSRRWDHIENLDEFFTHIYEYHQNSGYMCIILQKIFSLLQFVFIMTFTTFFTQCVNYDFLFANSNGTTHGVVNSGKRHFSDAVIENCPSHLSIWIIFAILAATVYWITRVIKYTNYILKMSEIQQFYANELKITDDQLLNLTWHEVIRKIIEVQKKLRLSIHTENIASIYVCHRVLRYKNYMTALVNKRVIQPVFDVPLIGSVAYLPNSLKHEIERILFVSSTAPWDGPNLKEEYKNFEMLEGLTKKLKDDCKFYGLLSLVLMPLMLPFQVMESFFSLIELIKRRPDGLGMRRYSNYGRYYVRHFNELDHELSARLNRSHRTATEYMEQFFSPVLNIVAKNVTFMAAAIAATLAVLSAWDEDVLQVEHVITVIAVCGGIVVVCRGMIPDENLVWRPEVLMTRVNSELHYLPAEWTGKAHTDQVRRDFDQLFQMKWMFFALEITSPIFTPFVLLFWLRPRCGELVQFLHDYTKRVDGLGDVCSFADMDIAEHGDPNWNVIKDIDGVAKEVKDNRPMVTSHNRANDGKIELSILHFKTTNPEWEPPKASAEFLLNFTNRLAQEASRLAPLNPTNFGTLGSLPGALPRAQQSQKNLLLESVHAIAPIATVPTTGRHALIGEGLHRIDGPVDNAYGGVVGKQPGGILASLYQGHPQVAEPITNSLRASGIDIDGAGAEMRFSAMFLRGLHDESRISQSRFNYGGTSMMGPHGMQSVFAMPEGFERNGESLIDIEGPSSSLASSVLTSPHVRSTAPTPTASSGLGDLNLFDSERSASIPKSRIVMRQEDERHQQINEEDEEGQNSDEEDDDDDQPPMSFRS